MGFSIKKKRKENKTKSFCVNVKSEMFPLIWAICDGIKSRLLVSSYIQSKSFSTICAKFWVRKRDNSRSRKKANAFFRSSNINGYWHLLASYARLNIDRHICWNNSLTEAFFAHDTWIDSFDVTLYG